MPEENGQPPVPNYKPNSQKVRRDEEKPVREVQKVTQGEVITRKKPIGSRIRAVFVGEDARETGRHILWDVLIPATKNMIFDMITEGARRSLFGGDAPSGSRGVVSTMASSAGRTVYNKISSEIRNTSPSKETSDTGYREIVLTNRGDAEMVRDELMSLLDEYGVVAVSDLYAAIGVTGDFMDTKKGWTNLSTMNIRQIREGYLLELPRAIILE